MNTQRPGIGEWYRLSGGELLEVVAFDAGDGTIEVQYFDGTVEEFDIDDWRSQRASGEIEEAEADPVDEDRRFRADRLDGLDLFE